jgi:hypothetical protein
VIRETGTGQQVAQLHDIYDDDVDDDNIAMDGACNSRPWLRKKVNVTADGGMCSNQCGFRQLHTGRIPVFLNTRHCALKLILCMRE